MQYYEGDRVMTIFNKTSKAQPMMAFKGAFADSSCLHDNALVQTCLL